jgi:hypothetical protein
MASTDPEELELLQRRAAGLNLYCNEHLHYDPCRGGGPLFVIEKRRYAGQQTKTFVKYGTPEQCWEFFESYAKRQ